MSQNTPNETGTKPTAARRPTGLSVVVTIIVFVVAIVGPGYAVTTRGYLHTLPWVIGLAACILAIGWIGTVLVKVSRPIAKDGITIEVLSALVMASALYGLGVIAHDLYTALSLVTPGLFTKIGIGVGVLVVGLACFWLRSTRRALWGKTEVLAGMALPVHRAMDLPPDLTTYGPDFWVFTLTAGIYLVVRGLDNIKQAQK
jgi:hypothetical protein